MAGTQSVLADDQRLLGIPRSRQTVAIIYPQYSTVLQGFPATSSQVLMYETQVAPSLCQCSARAAQDIWEHHRPAVGSSMHVLDSVHSTSEKLISKSSGIPPAVSSRLPRWAAKWDLSLPNADLRLLGGRYLTRYRNQPDKSLHQSGAAMHHHPQDQERALNLSIPAAS